MQTGSSGTLIGWKSGQTTFVPLWDRMEGACLWTPEISIAGRKKLDFAEIDQCKPVLLGRSLAGNPVKPLMSLYGTEWRDRGYGLGREWRRRNRLAGGQNRKGSRGSQWTSRTLPDSRRVLRQLLFFHNNVLMKWSECSTQIKEKHHEKVP